MHETSQERKPQLTASRLVVFSLRFLMLIVTGLAVWLGWYCNRAHLQKQAVDWIEMNDGNVLYRFQMDDTAYPDVSKLSSDALPGPKWIREKLGIHFVATVDHVELSNISELKPIIALSNVRSMSISGIKNDFNDVTPLIHFPFVERLSLRNCSAANYEVLGKLKHLKSIYLTNVDIENIDMLSTLPHLLKVAIHETKVSKLDSLAELEKLEEIRSGENQIRLEDEARYDTLLPNYNIDMNNGY